MNRVALVQDAIDPAALVREAGAAGVGATCLFVGTVRDVTAGRAVTGVDYTAYGEMAERELGAIAAAAAARFGTTAVVVEHRTGSLAAGDISVGIAASHPHRAPACDAMRWVIEEIKRRVPIWKRERYVDGTWEWVDPTHATAAAEVA
jgi:molybdopterin synthase catalytic subunit